MPKTKLQILGKVASFLVGAVMMLLIIISCAPAAEQPQESAAAPQEITTAPQATATTPQANTAVPNETYTIVIDQGKPFVAGLAIPIDIDIFDQTGKPFADFDATNFGKYLYYAYVGVAPLDLSSFQANPILVDPQVFKINLGSMEETNMQSNEVMQMTPQVTPEMQMTPEGTPQMTAQKTLPEGNEIMPVVLFPKEGQYVVFVEFTPRGGKKVVVAAPVDVGSAKTQAASLTSDSSLTQSSGAFKVTLNHTGVFTAGQPAIINFEITDAQGNVVSEAVGLDSGSHCVVYAVDESLTSFIRTELTDPKKLQFLATFPKPGKYKTWFEFMNKTEKFQVTFVLEVK